MSSQSFNHTEAEEVLFKRREYLNQEIEDLKKQLLVQHEITEQFKESISKQKKEQENRAAIVASLVKDASIENATFINGQKDGFLLKWTDRRRSLENEMRVQFRGLANQYLEMWRKTETEKEEWIQKTKENLDEEARNVTQRISDTFDAKLWEVTQFDMQQIQQNNDNIQTLGNRSAILEDIISKRVNFLNNSHNVVILNLYFFKFLQKLKKEKPYEQELSLIKKTNPEIDVVPSLDIISHSARTGVKSLDHLQRDFLSLYDTNYYSLNVTEASFIGTLKAFFNYFFSPKLYDEGLVPGKDPKSVITRAQHYLNKGQLSKTIAELNLLPEPLSPIFKQWIAEASKRIEIDRNLPNVEKYIQKKLQHQINEHQQL